MSRREDIDNAIWSDPEFEALSPYATLLYLWSFTNARCGMAGMYKVSHRAMLESKVPADSIPAALNELATARFAFYEDNVLFVRTRVKHLRSRSPQMAKAVVNDLLKLPVDHVLRARFTAEYGSDSWLRDELKRTYREPIGNLSEKPVGKGDSDTLSGTSREVPGKGQGEGSSTTNSTSQVPDSFPRELEPHLDAVLLVLSELAARQGAKAVSRLSLASVMMAPDRRHKPFIRAAHDYAAWADGQAQRRKDVVSGYRNWLDRTDDLAAIEVVGVNGHAPVNPDVPRYLHPTAEWMAQLDEHLASQPKGTA